MSAGRVWRRPDGLRWVEIQASAVDPSGWRLMVPLVELDDAPDAPPLVVTLADSRARTHLLRAVAEEQLGQPDGELDPGDLDAVCRAARDLITPL